jgi:hypothetical protein
VEPLKEDEEKIESGETRKESEIRDGRKIEEERKK